MPLNLKSRQNIYIACEDLDFTWQEHEVNKFSRMWREGKSIETIAKELKRDIDEVAILVIDRAKSGYIKPRERGVFGND